MTAADSLDEIRANWQRAQESVKAAQLLLDSGLPDIAASRAYYAAFYAACALLLSEGKEFSKHTAVQAAIHKDFVRTGLLSQEDGRVYGWLFELRGIGDYGETAHVIELEAREATQAAGQFVGSCGELLRSKGISLPK